MPVRCWSGWSRSRRKWSMTRDASSCAGPELELGRPRDQGSSTDERWHVRSDGTRFWGSGIVSAVRGHDGALRGFVKVLRDNTERKLAEEALETARHEAEAANEAKDQF